MGLFGSSGPNYSKREERLLDLAYDGSNDGKRRDALDKLARTDNGPTALGDIVYDTNLEGWIRQEAIDKLEYCRAIEELGSLVDETSMNDRLRVQCVEALGSLNARGELSEIAEYYDGKDPQISNAAFKYI